MDRRNFIVGAAAWMIAHDLLAEGTASVPRRDADPRIRGIRLQTHHPLEAMADFYVGAMGMRRVRSGPRALVVEAGATRLEFVYEEPTSADTVWPQGPGGAFYHFAFNIPENKIAAARDWQLERTPLFETPDPMRDPAFAKDVRHFRSWNAHSVFFYDPAGNVVEHIARHDMNNAAPGAFSPKDFLCVSEIALVTDDVEALAQRLMPDLAIEQYRGGGQFFRALGDEHGLVLLFGRGREQGLGSGKLRRAAPFPCEIELAGTSSKVALPEGPYFIRSG
ncbi:MAG: hypothetical protein AAF481_17100 [Acidobacteriota bacterium]